MGRPLRICFLGGVPAALGGGGLEIQMERTAEALRGRGHEVSHATEPAAAQGWDVAHAFGSEGLVQSLVEHWTRNTSPLVISPIVSVRPGRGELALRAASRLPAPVTHARARRRLLETADTLIALTDYEHRVLRDLAGHDARIVTIGNGALAPLAPATARGDVVLMLGQVNANKRQVEVLETTAGRVGFVVAGGLGPTTDPARWANALATSGAQHLGHVHDHREVSQLLRRCRALVQLSHHEVQSLAVLEALAHATPVVLSDHPAHRELAALWPSWVRVVTTPGDVEAALGELEATPPVPPAPAIPTWDDVAGRLEKVYLDALGD